jgi:hypothetical protein
VTTIVLTNSTQYSGSGGKSAIKVGPHIIAEGAVTSDGKTMTASQVSAGAAGSRPHGAPSTGTAPSSGNSSMSA